MSQDDKNIRRIGRPPPSVPAVHFSRKDPKDLLKMGYEELEAHLKDGYDAARQMMDYFTAVRDAMMLREDIERRKRQPIEPLDHTHIYTHGLEELNRISNMWAEFGETLRTPHA